MRVPGLFWPLLVAAGSLGVAGCAYDPQFPDDMLQCSPLGECPQGYRCLANACYSNASRSEFALNQYLGDWIMGADANVTTKCGTAAEFTDSLADTVMSIGVGASGVSDLSVFWLCEVQLRIDPSGVHILLQLPRSCSEMPDSLPAVRLKTWTTTQFDLVTTNGKTAMHTARYDRRDDYVDGAVDQCNQIVRASLVKSD